jgi:hypothetical protein
LMSLRLHVMVTKNSDFFVPNDCSYGQLAKIQNFYLSLRLWSKSRKTFGVSTTKFVGVKVWGYLWG